MNPYYYNIPTYIEDEAVFVVLGILLVILAVILVASLAFWIIQSVGLHTLAKRRGIRNAWLAWLPVGNYWILGSIADQYQHLVQGKITSRRKIMLILSSVGIVMSLINNVLSISQTMMAASGEDTAVLAIFSLIPAVLTIGVGIASMVYWYICGYDLYRSCNPDNAVIFLVLGIILPVTEPFFVFSCRKKDLGMIRRPVEPNYFTE